MSFDSKGADKAIRETRDADVLIGWLDDALDEIQRLEARNEKANWMLGYVAQAASRRSIDTKAITIGAVGFIEQAEVAWKEHNDG